MPGANGRVQRPGVKAEVQVAGCKGRSANGWVQWPGAMAGCRWPDAGGRVQVAGCNWPGYKWLGAKAGCEGQVLMAVGSQRRGGVGDTGSYVGMAVWRPGGHTVQHVTAASGPRSSDMGSTMTSHMVATRATRGYVSASRAVVTRGPRRGQAPRQHGGRIKVARMAKRAPHRGPCNEATWRPQWGRTTWRREIHMRRAPWRRGDYSGWHPVAT